MKLSAQGARFAIAAFSLGITGLLLCFLIIAPEIGVPFNPGRSENINLAQTVIPVFLGYLGSASYFLFRSPKQEVAVVDEQLLWLMVFGPFFLYIFVNVVLFVVFTIANKPGGHGMLIEDLAKWFSLALGVLTFTISVVSNYVFGNPSSGRGSGRTR